MIKNIWDVPKYLPFVQPAVNESLISEAEAKMGFKFPKEYIKLLRVQNGGYIRYTLNGTPHRQVYGIGPYYPSITNFEWLSEYDELSFEVKDLFPFDGDGHWNICLDYRINKNSPQITYIDTETDYENVIAESFQAYLNKLVLRFDDNYLIDSEMTIQDLLSKISTCLDIKFLEPGSINNGYPVYAAHYKQEVIQISPNKVPSGFIRKGDKRYDELKSQMEEQSLRFPEFSGKNHFLSVYESDIRLEIVEKISEDGIPIKNMKELLG